MIAVLTSSAVAAAKAAPSLDEKIGQMLMVGFRGMALEDGHFIVDDIRHRHLGGVILFDYDLQSAQYQRNIASPPQLQALISDLQRQAPTPLLVAIDQEGGRWPGSSRATVSRPRFPIHGWGSKMMLN